MNVKYPSTEHEDASKAIVDFFSGKQIVEAVILYGSCARGKASVDSCLDILILVTAEKLQSVKKELEMQWGNFHESEEVFETLLQVGRYSHVDLNFIDGQFEPKLRHWTSGPDEFELELGNTLVHSVPLWERGDYLKGLKEKWLPYYNENLRKERLAEVRKYCLNNLDHIPLFVDRGLYFQAFNRFYDAFREFLQGLFISRRIYPIAYDKWINEQLEDILELPELYKQLKGLIEVKQLESQELTDKANELRSLFEKYVIRPDL
jgi:predicted nucleotidyltransferase